MATMEPIPGADKKRVVRATNRSSLQVLPARTNLWRSVTSLTLTLEDSIMVLVIRMSLDNI